MTYARIAPGTITPRLGRPTENGDTLPRWRGTFYQGAA
jgi:hypothetical protein